MNAYLMEKMNLKQTAIQNSVAGVTGDRVSMKDAKRVSFLVLLGSATSATGADVLLKQHDAASGGTSKALSVANKYYHKIAAATSFTQVAPTVAADTYSMLASVGDDTALLVFEVLAEDVDRAGGFDHVSVDLGAAGVARQAAVVAVLDDNFKPSYGSAI